MMQLYPLYIINHLPECNTGTEYPSELTSIHFKYLHQLHWDLEGLVGQEDLVDPKNAKKQSLSRSHTNVVNFFFIF